MRRILSVADSIENTRYSVQRCVNTYNDYNVESMIAVPQFTGEDADEQTDIGEVLDYCFSQEKFDAIFIGMIRDAGAVNTVSNSLLKYDHPAVVAELSIISPEGKILISRETYDAIVGSLMQNVHFLTINLYEAELLSGIECHGPADARQAAETICEKFHSVVFIEGCKKTGGRDLFVLGGKAKWFDGTATHSPTSKKNFTAAVACELAGGKPIKDAVTAARLYCGISSGVEDETDHTVQYVPASAETPKPVRVPVVEAPKPVSAPVVAEKPKTVQAPVESKVVPAEPAPKVEAAKEPESPVIAPVSSLVSPAKSIRDAVRNLESKPSRIKFESGISIPSNGILARELAKSSKLTAVTSNIETPEPEVEEPAKTGTSLDDMFERLRRLSEM